MPANSILKEHNSCANTWDLSAKVIYIGAIQSAVGSLSYYTNEEQVKL